MKLPLALTHTFLRLCLGAGMFALTAQQQAPPPELSELQAASQIAEIPARIKELQRIKAAYPNSRMSGQIDAMLLEALSRNAGDLDEILAAQREIINPTSRVLVRFDLVVRASNSIFTHPKADTFPKPALLKAVQDYRAEGLKILDSPEYIESIVPDRRSAILEDRRTLFEIPLAKAYSMAGDAQAALNTLDKFEETKRDANWRNTLGEVYSGLKRDREALGAFFDAAAEGHRDANASAKKLYTKLKGSDADFDAELERVRATRPFQPPPFTPPANWKGKTVLAEVFTGSECPPCVAAGFGFDGLKESYPTQYLAVLKYHLPIPLYDPMMNSATKKRQDYYGVRSTPTAIIDGVKDVVAGGGRSASFATFTRAKKEIDSVLTAGTDVTIKATATLRGDTVQVNCEFSKVIQGADYHVVLVQTEEEFKGSNGIAVHKMVVRDIETVKPTDKATVTFDIPASEKAAGDHITEWGKTAPESRRRQPSQWPVQQNKIDRAKLKAVVFVQDTNTKQVHNAFVADVSK